VGVLTLLLLWRWARRAFDAEIALLALLFLAISPWHVLFSRWAQQGIFVPMWLTLGLLLFERGRLAAGRGWWLAGFALGLAMISYAPMRVTVPLFLVALAAIHFQDLRRNRQAALLAVLAFLAAVAPTAIWMALHREEGLQRWSRVSIWQEDASLLQVVSDFFFNYLRHLSIPFLFLHGDENLRHSVSGFGQMHWIELPGLIAGLLLAFTQRRPQDLAIAAWFLLAPIAPSLTLDAPHALRDIAALPAAHVLSALGTAALFRGLVRSSTEPLRRPRSRLRDLQEWVQVNIEGLRAVAIVAVGVTALVFALTLTLLYPHRAALVWETGLHDALRAAAPFGREGRPIFVSGSVIYLPAHLGVALPRDPPEFQEVEPYLQPPWNQTGGGEMSPDALWRRFGGENGLGVFIVMPGEIPDHLADSVVHGPANRFTSRASALWEIHVGQSALESRPAVP
jgi:4-amino-4-deoxy-L-arabinose transferase-like glycosyltransferase